jgi:hypothetical protein
MDSSMDTYIECSFITIIQSSFTSMDSNMGTYIEYSFTNRGSSMDTYIGCSFTECCWRGISGAVSCSFWFN